MLTNSARIITASIFTALVIFFAYEHVYELAGVALMFVALLTWGYFKEGTVVLAAKSFHNKEYDKAEALLLQIPRPEWLNKKRRGFYEFMLGGICLYKQDYEEAERHYELAAQYPLRSVNDHVAALAHVVNISIRQQNIEKAQAYLSLADKHQEKITAKMKSVLERLHAEIKKYQNQ